jgi:hypothetical protein
MYKIKRNMTKVTLEITMNLHVGSLPLGCKLPEGKAFSCPPHC